MPKASAPMLLTAARALCGALAIHFAMGGDVATSARLIIIGLVLDGLDGLAARLLGVESEVGAWFDYFADYLCMVVAPAVVVLQLLEEQNQWLVVTAASTAMIAGGLRYARNGVMLATESFADTGFPGLGTVFFALFVAGLTLLDWHPSGGQSGSTAFTLLLSGVTLAWSGMTLTRVRYPKFTQESSILTVGCVFLVALAASASTWMAALLLVAVVLYATAGPLLPPHRRGAAGDRLPA